MKCITTSTASWAWTQLLCTAGVTRQQGRSPEPVSANFILMSRVGVYRERERENEEGDVAPHPLHVSRDQKLPSYDRASLKLRPLTSVSTVQPSRPTACQKQAGSKGRKTQTPNWVRVGWQLMTRQRRAISSPDFANWANSSASHLIWFLLRWCFS